MSRERQEQVKVKSLSRVRLFVTPWTGAYQVPPSMEFPGKSTGVGCHFLLQGIILTQGSNPVYLIAGRHFTIWATWQEEAVPTYSGGVAGAPGRSLGQRVFRNHASLWKISLCPVFEVQKKNGSVCHCCCSTTQSCLTLRPHGLQLARLPCPITNSRKWKWSRSVVFDSATPWTVAHQAPLSIGFSRQEYWSGLPFPSPGDLPNPGIEPGLPHCGQMV